MIFLEFSIGAVGMAALVVGIVGLLVGVLLGIAAKAFAVKVDERKGACASFCRAITAAAVATRAAMPWQRRLLRVRRQ